MNTNQDTTLTNQDEFNDFIVSDEWVEIRAISENSDELAENIWRAATKGSEQRIQELENKLEAMTDSANLNHRLPFIFVMSNVLKSHINPFILGIYISLPRNRLLLFALRYYLFITGGLVGFNSVINHRYNFVPFNPIARRIFPALDAASFV